MILGLTRVRWRPFQEIRLGVRYGNFRPPWTNVESLVTRARLTQPTVWSPPVTGRASRMEGANGPRWVVKPVRASILTGRPFSEALRIALLRPHGKGKNAIITVVAENLAAAAAKGEQWAIKECFDRIDGKPAQSLRPRSTRFPA
jgi:hypothetical protein